MSTRSSASNDLMSSDQRLGVEVAGTYESAVEMRFGWPSDDERRSLVLSLYVDFLPIDDFHHSYLVFYDTNRSSFRHQHPSILWIIILSSESRQETKR